jgi:glyoxylase-like metal-dependent hydrolase (beta-lactamase superfamily II)
VSISRSYEKEVTDERVHLIEVPTPFAVGAVNCYLIEGSPLTLIDTGVKSSKAEKVLRDGLQNYGYDFFDIEQILLTHGHVDHIGLTRSIVDAGSGNTQVWIHEQDAIRLTDYNNYIEERMHSYIRIAKQCGTPADHRIIGSHRLLADYFRKFGEPLPEVNFLQDETILESGIGPINCIWVPGHSQGSMCFVSTDVGVMFSGDHILGDISSNPSLDFEGNMRVSMLRYFDSLRKVEPYATFDIFPGHRSVIPNLKERIDELIEDYEDKFQRTRELLSQDPITIYELSRMIYGEYPDDSLVLALAETKDLVLVLEQKGHAKLLKIDGVLHSVEN